MTIQETPNFRFKYMDVNEPFKNLPGVTQQVAERLEQALTDAQIPPGNPDLNAVLARLVKLEALGKVAAYTATGSKSDAAGNDQYLAAMTYNAGASDADMASPAPPGPGGAAGGLVVPAGTWSIDLDVSLYKTATMALTGDAKPVTGRAFIDIANNDGSIPYSRTTIGIGEDRATGNAQALKFTAPTTIRFMMYQTTGGLAYYRAQVRLLRVA